MTSCRDVVSSLDLQTVNDCLLKTSEDSVFISIRLACGNYV